MNSERPGYVTKQSDGEAPVMLENVGYPFIAICKMCLEIIYLIYIYKNKDKVRLRWILEFLCDHEVSKRPALKIPEKQLVIVSTDI